MSVAGKRLLYAATVFWSALLLLLVQPVLTKAILPWFGGSAGVWTTSMLFYQTLLLLGYAYAHALARGLPLPVQVSAHAALLVGSLLLLPLEPSAQWKPATGDDPLRQVLVLLVTTAGLPYFLLAATSPLLQSWFARTIREEAPYRLFALSNLGSLVALLAYPLVVEPLLPTRAQILGWSMGYGLFVAFCLAAAFISRSGVPLPETPFALDRRAWTWLGLAVVPSVLWLAVANHLSQDVAAVPFVWVLPLAIYLLSFVLCFDHDRWYRPMLFRYVLPLAWAAIILAVAQQGYITIRETLYLLAAALFVICMFCHGELARQRPEKTALTGFYLTIAGGGAAGGIFVGLIAPYIFNEYLELPIGMLGSVMLALWLLYGLSSKRVFRISGVTTAAAAVAIYMPESAPGRDVRARNFYGTVHVTDTGAAEDAYRSLFNGTIQHGIQFLSPERSRIPTTYYGYASGAAIAIDRAGSGTKRVGVIGLGAGTLAAYGKPGDVYRFYEINPVVIHLAEANFRFLSESKARIEVVPADARLSLEREAGQHFDVLAVDAFSGDSIPVHLLTMEAFDLYFRHTKPEGALAIHVTNKHLDLAPIVQAIANRKAARALLIHNSSDNRNKIYSSSWVVVTRNHEFAGRLEHLASPILGHASIWTDDYTNLLRVLK